MKKGQTPPIGRPWQKGQSGNPKGRPPIPEDVKKARGLTQNQFERVCGELFFMTHEKLEEVVEDKKTPVLKALVARILLKGIKDSSRVELNYFVERFLGKVPEEKNFNGNLNGSLVDFLSGRGEAVQTDDDEDDVDEEFE